MNHRVSTLEDLLILERNLAYSLGAMSDLDAALKTLLETCLTIEGIDCGGIYRMDSTGACDLVLHRHHSPQFIQAVQHFGAESWEAQRVQEGKPIYLQLQSLTLPEMKALWGVEGIRAVAVIPIAHAGHVVICLNVGTKTTDGIPLLIRQCIESIALHSGSVLARLHLEEELRETQ
ncbi:MAG: GAF domain-containing protein, partial [bacterium]|nr:GAF domain-containing protein [bacterium]